MQMIGVDQASGRPPLRGGPLTTLCYQSRAPGEPGSDELDDLLTDARDRNRRLGVTGMLVYEGDRFFQWLEGPSEALGGLWTSINRDSRHREVELLGEGVTPVRLFSGWDLRFLDRRAAAVAAGQTPEDAAPAAARPESAPAELARLALDGDGEGMAALLRGREGAEPGADGSCRALFEAAAHQLGDWWCEDVCSSCDITLALGRLQSLVRTFDAAKPALRRVAIQGQSILVSPPPRETHLLGAALLGGVFHRAGWSVQAEFPQEDPELMGLVSTHWFDALALTLSDVFTRRDRLTALIQTIKDVRAASRNPRMAVIVGGRAFRGTDDHGPERVGADVHYASAGEAVKDLDYWLFMQRFATEAPPAEDADEGPATSRNVLQAILPELKQRVLRRAR